MSSGYTNDPALLRLRVPSAVSAADMEPPGLSPSAILLVRHVDDPAPGALLEDRVAWERAMRELLASMLRRAVRPAVGPVPGNTPAVLFLDRAEFLACYARDCRQATAPLVWWWRRAFVPRRQVANGAPPAIFDAWSGDAVHVPGALEWLHRAGAAIAVLRTLTVEECRTLLVQVAREFHLPPALLDGTIQPEPPRPLLPAPQSSPVSFESRVRAFLETLAIPVDLPDEPAVLLATALALQRAPSLARSVAFLPTVRRWLAHRAALRIPIPPPIESCPAPPTAEPAPFRLADRIVLLPEVSPPVSPELPTPSEESPVITEIGGVLFLIHAVMQMDLDALLSDTLSGWGLLEALAASLVPEEESECLGDPVWALLAECDGREPREPLPPLSDAVTSAIAAAAERLSAALDTDRPLFDILLRRRGRLEVTRSHIDLFMPLDSATTPVRLAGLDCNPGFVPLLGRVISFHYL
jgi:hypothetical protein